MNYYVDIIDTADNSHTTIIEKAAASSIVIDHEGKDAKNELFIMGSSILFTMEVPHDNNVDGTFLHLFTGDETRYRVELKKETDDSIVWQGFLLPESYQEPYTQGNFFVEFMATDGLGRLKGKYLPDNFYQDEIAVTEIVCKCLELTGLQLDVYISPAIQHSVDKLWHTKYIDTLNYIEKNKKHSAYKILKTICNDWLSTCFMVSNQWRIEGWNIRNLISFTAQKYSYTGVYDSEVEITRVQKNIKNLTLQTPFVTIVPPYKNINVTHERIAPHFPDTIAQEANEGWAVITGVQGRTYATDWNGNNGCYAYALAPDYDVCLFPNGTLAMDYTKFINLRKKVYVGVHEKIKLSFKVRWDTNFYYDVTHNGTIIFSNRTGDITTEEIWAGDEDNFTVSFEYVTVEAGLLDVIFYQPLGIAPHDEFSAWKIYEVKIESQGFEDEQLIVDTINDEYTTESDHELIFADDASGFSRAFLLAKLREANVTYNEIDVPIKYGYTQNGINYSIVELDGANLIYDNLNTTYYGVTLLTNLEVIYNLNAGEEMAVVTDTLYDTGSFKVRVYKINDYTADRSTWQMWTDSVYAVETIRYAQAAANVIRRLYLEQHQKVDLTVMAAIKPDDMVIWDYLLESKYVVTNCSWDLDNGETTLTIIKAIYQNTTGGTGDNIPPLVNAGPDQTIDDGVTTANLDATAFDPDGFIAGYMWEMILGTNGAITTPFEEDTALSGLTDDEYEFKITVTDNDGATASDTVKIFRKKEYTFSLVEIACTTPEANQSWLDNKQCEYQLQVTPQLPGDFVLQVEGDYNIENSNGEPQYLFGQSQMIIKKNGAEIHNEIAYENEDKTTPFSINFIDGNDIRFIGYIKVEDEDPPLSTDPIQADASFTINITNINFITGDGTSAGLPITETESVSITP